MMLQLLIWSVATIIASGVIWWGTSLLEEASERLSEYYGVPDIVQGAVIIAVGSSFPELSTTTLSALIHDEFELGVAAIVGSAIFNVMVIPALSSLSMSGTLDVSRALVYKEAQFYIISIATLLIVFSLAVIYYPVNQTPGMTEGKINRGLALLPILFYGLYIFIQYQDTMQYGTDIETSNFSPWASWVKLLVSLIVILGGVELLIKSAIEFGDIFNTPSFLWGITIVAAGTSLPDSVMSIRKAKNDQAVASIANVLGSNVFDLLVCIPAGILIAGSAVINYTVAVPMMTVLIVATVLLFTLMRTNMVLSVKESVLLLGLYTLFIIWINMEYFDFVNFLPGIPH